MCYTLVRTKELAAAKNRIPDKVTRQRALRQRSPLKQSGVFVGCLPIPERLSAPNRTADLRQTVAVEYISCEPTSTARELLDGDAEPEE